MRRYVRDTRRAIGVGGFRLRASDLVADPAAPPLGSEVGVHARVCVFIIFFCLFFVNIVPSKFTALLQTAGLLPTHANAQMRAWRALPAAVATKLLRAAA